MIIVFAPHDVPNTPILVYLKVDALGWAYSKRILEPVKPKPPLQVEYCSQLFESDAEKSMSVHDPSTVPLISKTFTLIKSTSQSADKRLP